MKGQILLHNYVLQSENQLEKFETHFLPLAMISLAPKCQPKIHKHQCIQNTLTRIVTISRTYAHLLLSKDSINYQSNFVVTMVKVFFTSLSAVLNKGFCLCFA